MGDQTIEWLDDPDGSAPVTPPRRGWSKRVIFVATAAVIVFVTVDLVIAASESHHRHGVALAKSSSPVALGTPTTSATSALSESAPTPTDTSPAPALLARCASLAGTSSARWLAALDAADGGCTLDGTSAANFSVLPCSATVSLYTSTASGTWYWGETGQVLHAEASNASTATFTDAYRHCTGFDTTRCLTAGQALALISRDSPGAIELQSAPSVGYRCVDGWAFINVHPVPEGNGGTVVLHLEHDEWIEGDRLVGCGDGVHAPTMPLAIRNGGCGD